MAPGASSPPTHSGQRRERVQGWGWVPEMGDFQGESSGETAVTLPSPGGLKHLTGDGSESTWLRHGKPVFSMQTSTPPPSNACNSHPRLGEESEGRFSSCSPLLETGRVTGRRKGICGALYLLPA